MVGDRYALHEAAAWCSVYGDREKATPLGDMFTGVEPFIRDRGRIRTKRAALLAGSFAVVLGGLVAVIALSAFELIGRVVEVHQAAGKGRRPLLTEDRGEEARILKGRIEVGVAAHRRAGADVRTLARGGRSTSEWVRAVALASDDHASFRAPAVATDQLWRVVEDPVAATTARGGAAIALRERLDEKGRERLRVAAEACAAPELRVALELAAGDAASPAIERAFDELVDEEPRKRRKAAR